MMHLKKVFATLFSDQQPGFTKNQVIFVIIEDIIVKHYQLTIYLFFNIKTK